MTNWLYRALTLIWLVSIAGVAFAQADSPDVELESPPETPAGDPAGYPVRLGGEQAFRLYDSQGVQEAVRVAEEHLLRIARDPFYSEELLTTEAEANGVWILYRDARVGFVYEEVAAERGMSAARRAAEIIAAVDVAVTRYHDRQRPEEWMRALLLLALATLLLVGAVYLVLVVHRRLAAWVDASSRAGLKLGSQRLGFRSAARLASFQRRAFRLARTLLIALVTLFYLQAAFTIVPLTRGYAFGVIDYMLDPLEFVWEGLLKSVGDLFFIAVIIGLARLLLRGIRGLLMEAASGSLTLPGVSRDRALPLYKIIRLAVIAITIVMIYPSIPGSSSAAFQGLSLFAGALFTLGASSTAGNFIGGMVLLFSGSFRVGDRVKIGNVVGDVVESTLALTRLRTTKNELVTFANGNVLNESFVNYSALAREQGVILHTRITIGYDVPWREVHELLTQAALRTQHVLEEPAPFVRQTSLNDFHVAYDINAYTHEAGRMPAILSELHQNIQDGFAEAGVEILSPAYSALRDGGTSTIPAQEAPADG
jgi:small-conductance mechanosensitive channel